MWGNGLSQWRCREEEEEDNVSLSSLSDVYSEDEYVDQQFKDTPINDGGCCDTGECDSCVKIREESRQYLIKTYNIQIPDKQQWIASWLENKGGYARRRRSISKGDDWALNLYGYYKKKKDVGGYGVILRDPGGRPVSAFAWSSKGRGSYLYYLLKGLRRGFKLALAHGVHYALTVHCNSTRLAAVADAMIQSRRYCLHRYKNRHLYKRMKFCEECFEVVFPDVKRSQSKLLVDIVKDIKMMGVKFEIEVSGRFMNEPAYYLAKHFRNKREVKPSEFPPALREFIWEDAYGGGMQYSESEWTQAYQEQIWKYLSLSMASISLRKTLQVTNS